MGTFYVDEEPFCEHCYDLEPFTLTWEEEDGCTWCMACATCGDFDFEHNKEEIEEWEEKARQAKVAHFEGRVKELKK